MVLADTRGPLVDPTRDARRRRMRPPRPRGELPAAALLALGMLAAYAGLHVLLQGVSWYVVGACFILLVIGAANVARRLVRPPWLPTLVAAAVAVLALTGGYAADRALLGLVPTPDVLARFGRLADQAWLSIAGQAIPATPELGIVFLLALLTAGCALFGDAVVRRAPALTVIPMLALLGVPVAVRADVADGTWYAVTAVLYLALLLRGRWRSALPWVVVSGAAVVVGSLLLPAVLPPVPEAQTTSGTGFDGALNPLVNLGDDLRRGAAVTAVTYTTSTAQAVYLRLATLDRFDGREWGPSDVQPPKENTVDQLPAPAGLTSVVDRTPITAQVQVGNVAGRWLPVPYPATSIQGLSGDWRWVGDGLSVRSQSTSASGQSYEVGFLDVEPDLTQLRAATLDHAASVGDLSLPDRMPSIIADTARQVTAGASTEYDKALALQNWFQSDGGFTYSETAPVAQGYDGTGAQIIAEFLQKKAGYCVHFASSMAVMARTLGIPARVAVGFQPGTATTHEGRTVFTVSSHDLHAWPELYFSGIGWLRFEPTPGRGVEPVYSQPSAVDDSTSLGSATGVASAALTDSATAGARAPSDPVDTATSPATIGTTAAGAAVGPVPWILLGVLLVALAILLTPGALRAALRVRRMRAIVRGRDPAAAAWAEVRDTARDHGWAAPETETARELAERLTMVLVPDRAAISGLRASVEAGAYARDPGPISVDDVRAVRRAIASTTSGRDRLRVVLLPASLVTRIRGEE